MSSVFDDLKQGDLFYFDMDYPIWFSFGIASLNNYSSVRIEPRTVLFLLKKECIIENHFRIIVKHDIHGIISQLITNNCHAANSLKIIS